MSGRNGRASGSAVSTWTLACQSCMPLQPEASDFRAYMGTHAQGAGEFQALGQKKNFLEPAHTPLVLSKQKLTRWKKYTWEKQNAVINRKRLPRIPLHPPLRPRVHPLPL